MLKVTRIAIASIVSILPLSAIRCVSYRLLFGYTIKDTRIGFGTVICVDSANLTNCVIGRFNRFIGPMQITIESGADIESHNRFECGEWAGDLSHRDRYERKLRVGKDARITNHHFFDLAGSFFLGDGSWIAGRGSQFWTHGVGVVDRDIYIGDNTYVGSAVRFAPGAAVGDNVIVGIGSVVTKKIDSSNALISGFPAQVVKEGRGWRQESARVLS